jgi:hypothetical protein
VTVEQLDVVDFAAIDPKTDEVLLVITDHLEWTGEDQPDKEHMLILQEKINRYLAFIESGEIYESYQKNLDPGHGHVSRECRREGLLREG